MYCIFTTWSSPALFQWAYAKTHSYLLTKNDSKPHDAESPHACKWMLLFPLSARKKQWLTFPRSLQVLMRSRAYEQAFVGFGGEAGLDRLSCSWGTSAYLGQEAGQLLGLCLGHGHWTSLTLPLTPQQHPHLSTYKGPRSGSHNTKHPPPRLQMNGPDSPPRHWGPSLKYIWMLLR